MDRQIEEDCKFLESEQIMDYSLLLGIHFRAPRQQLHTDSNISNEGKECIVKEMNDRDGKESNSFLLFLFFYPTETKNICICDLNKEESVDLIN